MGRIHKHRELIAAWANGADIESLSKKDLSPRWKECANPFWGSDVLEFRIKPDVSYPDSSLTDNEIEEFWQDFSHLSVEKMMRKFSKFVIERHCQDQEKEGK